MNTRNKNKLAALLTAWALCTSLLAPAAAAGETSATEMAGLSALHRQGLDGRGTVIAVIDTGLDVTHPAFSAEGMDGSAVKLTRKDVMDHLGALNAGRMMGRAGSEEVYVSAKLPFVFDYTKSSTDVSHTEDGAGDHGTSVAQAAAGVQTERCAAGAAPGAQLLAMKVFGDHSQSASERALLYAIEDAVALGADVINLSLGVVSGFPDGGTLYSDALRSATEAGIIICAAAGNEHSSAYGNNSGQNLSLAGNVDVGVLSEPGTMTAALSVASLNSATCHANGLLLQGPDGSSRVVSFRDSGAEFGLRSFVDLLAVEGHRDGVYEYAAVPGIGTEEDFDGVDVRGRIALIQRGEITFVEKSDHAFARGALGVIVYNNVDESIGMDMTGCAQGNDLPCVIITREDGEAMVSAAGSDGVGTLTILSGDELIEDPKGWRPSDFSSWGPLSDLTLKPELSAVGGNVWCAADGGEYMTRSGTSLASPQAAGAAAVLLQHVRQEYGLTGSAARARVLTLLMNAAQPLTQENGAEYSPRKQGAGALDAGYAVETPARVSVAGSALPKAELGDDKDRTGVYSFTFTVHNDSDTELRYILRSSMLTETEDDGYMLQQARKLEYSTEFSGSGVSALYELDGDGRPVLYDVTGDGVVTLMDSFLLERAVRMERQGLGGDTVVAVPAGGEEEVRVTVRLTDGERDKLAKTFENGVYVEGYVYLDAMNGLSPSLSIPVLAFYGGWGEAPLFERTSRAELDSAAAEGVPIGNSSTGFLVFTGDSGYLGANPMAQDEVYIPERSNALNTTGRDGGVIDGIGLDLLRNARKVTIQIVSGGRVLYERSAKDLVKSGYSGTTAKVETVSPGGFYFNPVGYGLGAGDAFTLRIIGEKDADGPNAVDIMDIPVYLDGKEPVIKAAATEQRDGRTYLNVTVQDDNYTAALAVYGPDKLTKLEAWAVNQTQKGAEVNMELDVTGLQVWPGGFLLLCASDYASNTTLQRVPVGN